RSAKPPASAPSAPHIRFCSAIEKENTSLPQPYSRLIGCRNRPKPARMPNEIVMMRQPAARTTSGVRQDFSMEGSLADERFSSRVHFACEGFLLLIRYNIATGELPEEVARDPGRESGHENDQQQHQALGAEERPDVAIGIVERGL